jgi:hypothetical protein
MSKEWTTAVAKAEASAQQKQAAEDEAQRSFQHVRDQMKADGRLGEETGTAEFREWMAARHASDEAWGAWAMAMDARPAS